MCDFDPKNGGRFVDPCLTDKMDLFKRIGIRTVACCCGHGKYPETIVLVDQMGNFWEMNSGTYIPRLARFYRKDSDGIYYIPEVSPTAIDRDAASIRPEGDK